MPTLNWIGKEAVVNHRQQVRFHLLEDVPDLACAGHALTVCSKMFIGILLVMVTAVSVGRIMFANSPLWRSSVSSHADPQER